MTMIFHQAKRVTNYEFPRRITSLIARIQLTIKPFSQSDFWASKLIVQVHEIHETQNQADNPADISYLDNSVLKPRRLQ